MSSDGDKRRRLSQIVIKRQSTVGRFSGAPLSRTLAAAKIARAFFVDEEPLAASARRRTKGVESHRSFRGHLRRITLQLQKSFGDGSRGGTRRREKAARDEGDRSSTDEKTGRGYVVGREDRQARQVSLARLRHFGPITFACRSSVQADSERERRTRGERREMRLLA